LNPVLDASRVAPGLYQGSAPKPGQVLPFDLVVLCAEEYQLPQWREPFGRRTHVLRVPLDDSGRPPTEDETRWAEAAGRIVAKARAVGNRVLVTCWQGFNRSGLVMGHALVNLGVHPGQAIQAVKSARGPRALSNSWFRQLLLGGT
jgi:protein-tyrosine phosphatase